jgi:hypothetical protein
MWMSEHVDLAPVIRWTQPDRKRWETSTFPCKLMPMTEIEIAQAHADEVLASAGSARRDDEGP